MPDAAVSDAPTYPTLFSPVRAGTHVLKNRIIMGSMHTRMEHASDPLARTSHLVDTVILEKDQGETLEASAKWMALSCDARWGKQLRGGWYEYLLRRTRNGLRIAGKKVVLLEDVIDGTIDLHQI